MGTSFIKPGIDKTNVNPPMFTHYNIVPIYGTEDTGDGEVNATPNNDDDKQTNQGNGIIDDTQEGTGETIIDKPTIEKPNTETGTEGNNAGSGDTSKPKPEDNTMNNNTDGSTEQAITPDAGWID